MTFLDFVHEHPLLSFVVFCITTLWTEGIVVNLCQVAMHRRKDGEK